MLHIFLCVSARGCVRASVCMCVFMCGGGGGKVPGLIGVCTCVRVSLLILHATHTRHMVLSLVGFLSPTYFSTFSDKRNDFLKKKLVNIKCVF